MPDRINIDVVKVTSSPENSGLDTVETIGLSELADHLRSTCGSGVPESDRAQRVSGALLRSMAKLSTDPEYTILMQMDQSDFIPHWLTLVEPVVASARTASGYVHRELTDRENNKVAAEKPIGQDFAYVYSVLELSSHAIAREIGLNHPSDLPEALNAAETVASRHAEVNMQRIALDIYLARNDVPVSYGRRIKEVRRLGGKVLEDTAAFLPRIVNAVAHVPAAE